MIKSVVLLSESNPLPLSSSSPPEAMVETVEVE